MSGTPQPVVCIYRVKAGKETEFKELLSRHWPTLRSLGLATDEPPRIFHGQDKEGSAPIFIEIFSWISEQASSTAHESPEVMTIWEPMGACTESRGGAPPMEFPHVQPLVLDFAKA